MGICVSSEPSLSAPRWRKSKVLSRQPGFQMAHVWYLSIVSVTLQFIANMWLLQREFARKLTFAPVVAAQPVLAADA